MPFKPGRGVPGQIATASHIVEKEDGMIYSKDKEGNVEFVGTDPGTVVQNAIDEGGMVVVTGPEDYTTDTTVHLRGDSGLHINRSVAWNYDAAGSAFIVEQTEYYFHFDTIDGFGVGDYGIRFDNPGFCRIFGHRIRGFDVACLYHPGANATGSGANDWIQVNELDCNNGACDYGILLKTDTGASPNRWEGVRFDIGVILHPGIAGLQAGDANAGGIAGPQPHAYHVFNIDVDGAGYANRLAEIHCIRSYLFFEGWTAATGNWDVEIKPWGEKTTVDGEYQSDLRVLAQTPEYMFYGENPMRNYLHEVFSPDSLTNWEKDVTGTGSVTATGGSSGYIEHSTGTTSGSWANLRRWRRITDLSFDRRQRFKTAVHFVGNADQILYLLGVGDRQTGNHYGFRADNDTLKGTVADGTTENTVSLDTFTAGTTYTLEAILYPGKEVRFFVNGDDIIDNLTSNLPSGGTSYQVHIDFQNTAAADKVIRWDNFDFWIDQKDW